MDDGDQNVLITGSTGLVGHRAYQHLSEAGWKVTGTSRSPGNCVDIVVDLTNPHAVEGLLSPVEPDVIIHTAAISRTDACDRNRAECHAINVDATCNLVRTFPDSKFVYFSTYAVYDTEEGHCDEDCKTNPANYYIQTKLEGEACVRRLKDHLIFRPSVIFGFVDHEQASKNYVMQLLDNIRRNMVTRSPRDQYFNPIWVDVVVEVLRRAIDLEINGIYNLGCNEDISKYEFNRAVMEQFGLAINYLEGVTSDALDVRRPKMGTISSAKIQDVLSYPILPLRTMIDRMYMSAGDRITAYLA